ncbi:MAG: hypothetical protein CMM54_09595 [Rhodospirillaceae bacterium]|nr:hypothetical protein [Rhodospirillaceae bacterium]
MINKMKTAKELIRMKIIKLWIAGLVFVSGSSFALGQWQTQSLPLTPGWNAVYLHVDSMHSGIAAMANGTPVEEVWLWQPELSTAQYVTNPDAPADSKSRWASWKSGLGDASSTLKRMPGNAAYLIKLGGGDIFTWQILGKPVPARYQWTTSGLNFIGVPSLAGSNSPSLEDYFGPAGDLLRVTDIFAYVGGDLGPTNPSQVYGLRTSKADRGKAFWMRSGTRFNRYFGPFELKLQSPEGVDFGDNLSAYRVRVRNLTGADLKVTLTGVNSEGAPNPLPDGEKVITGPAPVIIRGDLNTETLAYSHVALSDGSQNWTLKPLGEVGSEVELVLGLDRSSMTGAAGSFYASVLRFTDDLGHSQRDIPVSGTVGSSEGLWIGGVSINKVRNTMKAADPNDSSRSISTDTDTFGDVASPYPLRLIVHREHLGGVSVINPGVTVSASATQGTGVNVTVATTSRAFPSGTQIAFSGGGLLTLTADAASGVTTLTGDLTVADLAVGETANSGAVQEMTSNPAVTVGSGVTAGANATIGNGIDVTVAATPRGYVTGATLTFSGGGVLTLTADVASGATTLTGDLTVADITSGETVTANVSQGAGVSVNVGATTRDYSVGDKIVFNGGGILTLTEEAATESVALTGDLTVSDLADGEAATSWTAGSTATSVAVDNTSRTMYAGEVLSFSGGGKVTLTENAAVNSTLLRGNLSGGNISLAETGQTDRLRLLQRAYVGILEGDVLGVATKESLLKAGTLASARRISSTHLPVSAANVPWNCNGELAAGKTLNVTVEIGHNDQGSNPFLHTYHPDHDNLSVDFKQIEPVGSESYRIKREIKLTFSNPTTTFSGLTSGGRQLVGEYEETMTLYGLVGDSQPNEKRFAMRGEFVINRITDIATLTME